MVWGLSDSNEIRTYNHLVRKRTFNHLAKLAKAVQARSSLTFRQTIEYGFPVKLVRDMITTYSQWCEELTKLSEIPMTQPRAAYAAFTSVYKHKFSYFMRTINCISYFMSQVEKIIKEKLIPALFDGFSI